MSIFQSCSQISVIFIWSSWFGHISFLTPHTRLSPIPDPYLCPTTVSFSWAHCCSSYYILADSECLSRWTATPTKWKFTSEDWRLPHLVWRISTKPTCRLSLAKNGSQFSEWNAQVQVNFKVDSIPVGSHLTSIDILWRWDQSITMCGIGFLEWQPCPVPQFFVNCFH